MTAVADPLQRRLTRVQGRARKTLLAMAAVASTLLACQPKAASDQKSFFALNARVAAGESPAFAEVAKWFSSATASAEPTSDPALAKAPENLRTGLIRYVQQQVQRTAELQNASRNPQRLKQLLDLETREMKDIVLALIMPGYQPETDDLFAALLAEPGIRDYIDAAAMPVLVEILQRPMDDLLVSMEQERLNYLGALEKQYLNVVGASSALELELQRNCGWLKAFLVSTQSANAAVTCSAGFSSAAGQGSGGAVPRFLKLFAGLIVANDLAAEASSSSGANGSTPHINANEVSPHAPRLSKGGLNLNGMNLVDDSTPAGGSPERALNLNATNCLRGFIYRDGGCVPVASSGYYAIRDWPGSGSATRQNDSAQSRYRGRPKVDCVAQGLTGIDLITCQRFVAYLPDYEEMVAGSGGAFSGNEPGASGGGSGFNLDSGRQSNLEVLMYDAMPVQNQGSEGACTAFGMTHTVVANMQKLQKNFDFDAWNLWSRYSRPYVNIAIDAAQSSPLGAARVGQAKYLRTLQQMLDVIDQRRAIYAHSRVDQTWRSTRRNGAILGCSGGGGGHAYSLHGYIKDASAPGGGYFIVKNSWGRNWGEDGYAYQPFACAVGGSAGAYDVDVSL